MIDVVGKGTAMELVRPSRAAAVLARLIVAAIVAATAVLAIVPWQQSAPGAGRVVAYAPDDRRQNLEAPIEGRVLRWYVREGSVVKKGDAIVELTDNDPDILARVRSERDAVASRLDAARARARSIESRIDSLEDSRRSAIAAAEQRALMATQRVAAAEQALALANATVQTAELNLERQKSLAESGLTSKRQLELVELDRTRAQTDVERAKVSLSAAQSEAQALSSDRQKVAGDASASINDARAAAAAAEAEVASASAELARVEVRLVRQSAMSVVAPRDGTVLRIVANGSSGETVKAGDVLAVLVPESADRAVELWISGNDMPLVRDGSRVRVQFEGWPAVQFSGWPSVAVGTFGGKVAVVDTMDDGAGKFRLLVVPEAGDTWPAPVYLRQGVRVQGWVQLGTVKLGYELWRQWNGFPPSLPKEPAKGGDAKDAKGGSK